MLRFHSSPCIQKIFKSLFDTVLPFTLVQQKKSLSLGNISIKLLIVFVAVCTQIYIYSKTFSKISKFHQKTWWC